MSYELSDIKTYEWGSDTIGATLFTHYIVGPRGKIGFVRDIMVDVTTAMSGTVVPEIAIGITASDATYGRYRLGSTASSNYPVGSYVASNELWVGNPPRNLQDYADHVKLDGCGAGGGASSYTSSGVAGGTYGTVLLPGRIPASGMPIVNVVSGGSSTWRVYTRDPLPYNLATNQLLNIHGATGVTGGNSGATNYIQGKVASGFSLTNNYFEVSGSTFGGTYTGGGTVDWVTAVSGIAGTVGPGGAGYLRVMIEWVGNNVP